ARDYDPDVGRWTAKDPLLFAGGDVDLYGYCLNNPVNFVDPDGNMVFGSPQPNIPTYVLRGSRGDVRGSRGAVRDILTFVLTCAIKPPCHAKPA
ncbi:MAG: RHS repeat-associated core domain-containing protein, partial [Pseudomonadota bacterium]